MTRDRSFGTVVSMTLPPPQVASLQPRRRLETRPQAGARVDVYFSADVETDGPIPGPYSMLSFALVYAGRFDGRRYERPSDFASETFYRELKPISTDFQQEALDVNGLDRAKLAREGLDPREAMDEASEWIRNIAGGRGRPVLVAYPLSFDWTWLYWYFVRFSDGESPFNHSGCFDIKTAYATKAHLPVSLAGRKQILDSLKPPGKHSHHALDDAIEQAAIFANLFEWEGRGADSSRGTTGRGSR
jgi:hypothetical protein